MRKEDDHVTLTAKEARSGDTNGGRVRLILIVGLVVVVVGMFAILAIWSQG